MKKKVFEHTPHPHIKAREMAGPTKTKNTASFGQRVGLRITTVVGTMTCAAVFTVIALISLPAAIDSKSLIIIVAWVAQTFLQLVLLSIIMVGQNVQSAAADARAENTFKDAEAILSECLQLQAHLQAQDAILSDLIEQEKVVPTTPKPPARTKAAAKPVTKPVRAKR